MMSSTRNDRYMDSTDNISSGYANSDGDSWGTIYNTGDYDSVHLSSVEYMETFDIIYIKDALMPRRGTGRWGWDKPVRTKIPNNYVRRKVNNRIRNTLPRKIRQIDL